MEEVQVEDEASPAQYFSPVLLASPALAHYDWTKESPNDILFFSGDLEEGDIPTAMAPPLTGFAPELSSSIGSADNGCRPVVGGALASGEAQAAAPSSVASTSAREDIGEGWTNMSSMLPIGPCAIPADTMDSRMLTWF